MLFNLCCYAYVVKKKQYDHTRTHVLVRCGRNTSRIYLRFSHILGGVLAQAAAFHLTPCSRSLEGQQVKAGFCCFVDRACPLSAKLMYDVRLAVTLAGDERFFVCYLFFYDIN